MPFRCSASSIATLLASGLLLAAQPVFAASPAVLWEPVAPLPAGIAGFAHGLVDSRPMIIGGTRWEHDTKLTLADRLVYDRASNTWTTTSPLTRSFAYGAYGIHEGKLHLLGGDDGRRTHSDGMTISSGKIADAASKLPTPVGFTGSAVLGGKLYLLGGTTDIREMSGVSAAFYGVDLARDKIESLPDFPDGPVLFPALAPAGEYLLVVSGSRWEASSRKSTDSAAVWHYAPASRQWTKSAPYPFMVRGLAACALNEHYVLLAGGYRSPGFTTECFLYDIRNDRYLALPPLPYAAMSFGLIRDGDALYMVGGEDRAKHRSSAAFRASVMRLLAAAGADAAISHPAQP